MRHTICKLLVVFICSFDPGLLPGQAGFLGNDIIGCDSVVLDAGAGTSYLWSTGDTGQFLTVFQTGSFSVNKQTLLGSESDTIFVEILPIPTLSTLQDTAICSGDSLNVVAQHSGMYLAWQLDSISGLTLSLTDTLEEIINQNAQVFLQSWSTGNQSLSRGLLSPGTTSTGNYYPVTNTRGLTFDVLEPFVLHSIDIYKGPGTLSSNLQLLNVEGKVLFEKEITLVDSGLNKVQLNVPIPKSNGYQLQLVNPSGASIYVDLPFSFPYLSDELKIIAGYPLVNHYNYFYNWEISPLACASSIQSFAVTVQQTPIPNLGADSIVCDTSLSLSTGTFATSYLWSTGDTTPILAISQPGLQEIWVQTGNGNCQARDTVILDLLFPPDNLSTFPDTSICGPQSIPLKELSPSVVTLWFDSLAGGNLLGLGGTGNTFIQDSTIIYAEGRSVSNVTFSRGLISPIQSPSGGLYPVTNTRGLVIDVFEPFLLESIELYKGAGTLIGSLVLETQFGEVLFSIPLSLPDSGANLVSVNQVIPALPGLRLLLGSPQGAPLFVDLPVSFPLNYPEFEIISGTPLSTHYNYLYNWKIKPLACPTSRTPLTINVLPIPQINLPSDTLVCASQLVLDVSFPGATYLWSTGNTTSNLLQTNLGLDTLWIESTLGLCTSSDTIITDLVQAPTAPTVLQDTSICGVQNYPLIAQHTASTVLWFDSLGANLPFASGDSVSAFVQDTTSFFSTAVNFSNSSEPSGIATPDFTNNSGLYPISNTRGLLLRVFEPFLLESLGIVKGAGTLNTHLELSDSENNLLFSKPLSLQDSGLNRVIINEIIPVGDNLFLSLRQPSGASLFVDLPVQTFPIQFDQFNIISGFPFPNHHNYFYDWRIRPISCFSTFSETRVNVKFPLSLPDYIYSCEDTVISLSFPAETYLWSTGDTTNSLMISQTGTYIVSVSDNQGCSVADTIFVEIPVDVGLQDDGILCGTVLTTNYDTTAFYLWSTGDTTAILTILDTGTYSVVVNEPRGCTLTDTILVTGFDEFPIVDLGEDIAACDSFLIDAGNPGLAYQWSTGDTSQTIFARASGLYTATVINENGCATTDTVGVNITRSPVASFSASLNGLQVIFINTSPNLANTYSWDFGDGNTSTAFGPTHTYDSAGTYLVTLIIGNECGLDTFLQSLSVSTVSAVRPSAASNWRAYPNPAQGRFWVEGTLPASPGAVTWRLIDLTGRSLDEGRETAISSAGIYRWPVETRHLPRGFYWLAVQDEHGRWQTRLTIQLLTP